ncbi:unnamed protein product [marine sediment metagenome]|uniref:FCP1 homology domain-containing protein n=1 Tax=marine sediment metagenome TaxID=412755 RepID=X1I9H9_9ZZZZ
MKLIIDIDGVIAVETPGKYSQGDFENAEIVEGAAQSLKELYKEHEIILNSARHTQDFILTRKWLIDHSIPYHGLYLGKIRGDKYIDDNAIKFTSWEKMMEELDNETKK